MFRKANAAISTASVRWKIASTCVAMSCMALSSSPARAYFPVDIITTGIVSSGTDSANQLGLGTSFSGQSYTLSVIFPAPDANYFVSPGSLATDFFNSGLPAKATLTIGSSIFTTTLITDFASTLTEGNATIDGALSGADGAGDTLAVQQEVFAGANFIAAPDLQTLVPTYTLNGNDFGSDTYNWANAADTQSISINGTTSSVSLTAVPEPASMTLFATGVLALLTGRRRRS